MFRARERGMSFWPFAVTLLAFLVAIFIWYGAAQERDQKSQSEAAAIKKAAEAEKAAADKTAQLFEVSKRVGFQAGGNMTDPATMDAQMKEYAETLKNTATATFPVTRYSFQEGGGVIEKTEGGTVTVRYLTDAELADVPTYQAYLSKFELAMKRMKFDIERSFAATESAITAKETAVKGLEETIREKDKRIAELGSEKSALDNQMREKETELKEQIAQITSAKEAKETENETLRTQAAANEAKLLAQLNEQTSLVHLLVQRDAPTLSEGPDGEVISTGPGSAIVNRGRKQWLMPGTIFDVWGIAKGGAKYLKGSIEITSCDDESARGAITKENPSDPIQKGDLVQSLAYSPNRQLHFVLVGEFKKMGRSTAERLLTNLGAKVDAKVSAETHYLVVGAPGAGQESLEDTPEVKAAKDLGIRMITEEQLSTFVRY